MYAQNVSSTSAGGKWNATTTWVGGAVPSASSNVTINGPVYANGDFTCNDLTIAAAGTLYNEYAYRPTITVNGKVTNNGTISTHPSGYELFLSLLKDAENNGTWKPNRTTFSGTSDQTIKQASGKKYEGYFVTSDSIGQIVLGSNVTFHSNTWELNKSKIKTNGYQFTAVNYQLNNGGFVSNDQINLRNTGIASVSFSGNYKIAGLVRIMDGIVLNGTATVIDTLWNQYAYRPTITVNAKIINNGKIITNSQGYEIFLNILNDIENNGVWAPNRTTFSAAKDQTIKQSTGKSFKGYFLTTDSIGQIVLGSDVTFESNTWDWNKSKLRTNGFDFTALNYQLNNGTIISDDKLILQNTGIASMTFTGNYEIDGNVRIQDGITFNGTVTVLDTLLNNYSYRPVVTVNGKIINKGAIIQNPSGYELFLDVYNDVENNGIWAPNRTTFASKNDQRIKQSTGKSFKGYFLNSDSIGDIILDSDVMFLGNSWQLNKSRIKTGKFNLNSKDYLFVNGKILSEATLSLKNSRLENISIDGTYKIGGRVYFQDGNVFNGTATVLDTLYNQYAYRPTIIVKGKIVNNGLITNHPSGYEINLNIRSDVENNGIWYPYRTFLAGKTDQVLKQSAGKSFQGYFQTTDTLGHIVLGSNVTFDGNTWDWSKSKLRTNGFKLTARNALFNSGNIISNDQLHFSNTRIADMNLSGNYKLSGKVRILDNNVFSGTATVVDTLLNEYAYRPTITSKGKLINNGAIMTNPSGYEIFLDILGDIENNGVWAPNRTTFSAKTNQKIKQLAGKSFQGYFLSSDSIGDIVLASDILLKGNTWDLNKCQIQTDSFKLQSNNYLLRGGKILSNDTLVLRSTRLGDMKFNGDYKIGGLVRLLDGNLFSGTVTVLDTVYNEYGYRPNMNIQGKLVNYGHISNHPSGYNLYISISGNLENNKNINITGLYLNGTGERNIGGRSAAGIFATVYADNAIVLVGDNMFPNLNFTNNPLASCTIKKGASLTLTSLPNTSKLKNFGRISVSQDIDNAVNGTYNFYSASTSILAKTPLNRLVVDDYGNQQHPTATGTINTWWRLRNTPQLFNDSVNWLKLNYTDDVLNGHLEDSIKVFHSPNSGMSWKRIKKGFTVDKTNNVVTINKAPSFGHYLLSSSALGVTSFQPLVESAEPRFGGNTGQLTMYLFGAGFKKTSTVKLVKAGQSDIVADSTWLTDALGEAMLAKFNLKNKTLGIYDVVIVTPGEKTITLPAYFEIMNGERSDPWSTISGRDRFLINRWQTFTIGYGNTANTDALGTILVFVVNDLPGLEVEFPDINVVLPKPIADMGPDFTRYKELGLYYTSESLSGYEGQKMRVYPFYIPYIAAGSSKTTRVRVRLNGQGSLKMDSWILDPLFERINYNLKSAEPMPSEVRACITAAAMKAWYNGALGLAEGMIPGVACWGVIDKTVDPIGYITPEELKPEKKDTWGSWFWNGVSIMGSAVQCGASFVPGLGQAVNLGIGLVNMGIDMKDNYDATQGCWEKFKKKSQNKLDSRGVTSFDPNEKVGPRGYTADRYISKEGNLNYTIFFENKKTAGASALEVFVTDTLDITKFDLKTFTFNSVTFGETTAKIQEYAKEFQILIDMYPKKDIIVQVHGKLDTIKGIISWDFHSLDRITMELTEDPDMGFLPPNVTGPEGEGNVTFSCKLKNTVEHGDVIRNRAHIVFDFNAPILTNTFTNRIDSRAPVSKIASLPAIQNDSTFTVAWEGDDLGSKISKFNIFVSTNDKEYILWKVAPKPGEAKFTGKNGNKYKFFSEAIDSLGIAEPMKATAEAVTTMQIKTGLGSLDANNARIQVFPNPASQQCKVLFNCSEAGEISIALLDISGKTIRMVEKQKYPAGKHAVDFNLEGVSEGVYIVKVFDASKMFHQKLVVSKK
jgi:hypothetical protein